MENGACPPPYLKTRCREAPDPNRKLNQTKPEPGASSSQVKTAADLITGSGPKGESLLVAFPDEQSMFIHAAEVGYEVKGSLRMSSLELLETWQASQQMGDTKLGGTWSLSQGTSLE